MRDSVPSGSYSSVCNVLRQWKSRSSLLIESTDSMILIESTDSMIISMIIIINISGGIYEVWSHITLKLKGLDQNNQK